MTVSSFLKMAIPWSCVGLLGSIRLSVLGRFDWPRILGALSSWNFINVRVCGEKDVELMDGLKS
jgi:hypothetical protein